MSAPEITASTFHADVRDIESAWQRSLTGALDLPLLERGPIGADPLIFVPILEHLEFVYARQIQALSQTRRVIMYRRHESHTRTVSIAERADELRRVLDERELRCVDLVGHGDAAMVLFEFAIRHPARCRSLIIIAQAADYQIAPHPFIWLLHEVFLRTPVEHVLPAWFLRRIVVNYIVARKPARSVQRPGDEMGKPPTAATSPRSVADPPPSPALPRAFVAEQFRKIAHWPGVYKFSVLPIIHSFDIRQQLGALTMPILLINRADDALAPEAKTRWLAEHLPDCAGYHVVPGGDRFFMYSQPDAVTHLMDTFLARVQR